MMSLIISWYTESRGFSKSIKVAYSVDCHSTTCSIIIVWIINICYIVCPLLLVLACLYLHVSVRPLFNFCWYLFVYLCFILPEFACSMILFSRFLSCTSSNDFVLIYRFCLFFCSLNLLHILCCVCHFKLLQFSFNYVISSS